MPDKPDSPTTTPKRLGEFTASILAGTPPQASQTETFPPDYATSPGVAEVLAAVDSDAPAIFVLGRAGTGKTTLVHYLRQLHATKRQVVLAPTGVAALNAGGQTIHSFFRLPSRLLTPADLEGHRARRLWREIDRIIIDEVSMVRVDIIDAIDVVLRKARANPMPFGGVQMVFVGDFLQLPPVTPRGEAEMLGRMGYGSPYAFSAQAFKELDTLFLRLETIYRQSDPEFIDMLGALRDSEDPEHAEQALADINARCLGDHRDAVPMLLCGTNARAHHYNELGLKGLTTPETTYIGSVKDKFDHKRDRLPVPETLVLKAGARVMAVKNDGEGRWVNGSMGTVTRLEPDTVWVALDRDGSEVEIGRAAWENIRYEWNETDAKVMSNVVGSYKQIPLILAWAATIHKAQGLSLDDVRVDLGGGAFASGQAYVAISRARSLEGLSLSRPLRARDVFVDPVLSEFERWVG